MSEADDWIDRQLMDSHQQRKHRRIIAIARKIRERGKVNYKRFLAEMQYYGIRKIVAEEYIEALKDLGKIKQDGAKLVWNDESDSS